MSKDHIAVVTGASLGLGKAMALAFVQKGVRVAGIARNEDTLAAAFHDQPVHQIVADVGDPASVEEAFREVRRDLGDPTILINNAAVYPHRDILDESPATFMATVNVNLGGAFSCCHAVLPAMVDRGEGRIINVATFADVRPAPLAAGYSVSKGAMRILTRSLLADLGDRFPRIVINDWIPGALQTRMGIEQGISPDLAAQWGVRLALMNDPNLSGRIFERNQEHIPAKSLKGKIKDRLVGQSRNPINLD